MKNLNLILIVSHCIFLTKEQRNDLQIAKKVEVIGTSVPVWHYGGRTSEPANEVYCQYTIMPTKYNTFIKHTDKNDYEIELPVNSFNPELNRENPMPLKNLKDLKDGGSEWLAFRQFGNVKRNKKIIQVIHFVEIKDISELTETII